MQYALRCSETDYSTLLTLATALGVITVVDGQAMPVAGCTWDFIGYKRVGAEPIGDEPETRPFLVDTNGVKYVHINAITSFDVREKATALALENPAIAGALSQIPRFFIVDAEGNATLPQFPLRVFL